jgi:hypothetical protein
MISGTKKQAIGLPFFFNFTDFLSRAAASARSEDLVPELGAPRA